MKRYCYRFPEGSNTRARAMMRYLHAARQAEREAQKYARQMGASEWISDPNFFAGGVAYLIFNLRPDQQIWRKATVIDGVDCYEPNVRQVQMIARVPHGFHITETWNDVYKKKPFKFDALRNRYPLAKWAEMAHYDIIGNDDTDWNALVGILGNDDFYALVRLLPETEIRRDKQGKEHPSRVQYKAVRAQKLRLSLPVVRVDELYALMDADLEAKDDNGKTIKGDESPTFFHYWKDWYFSSAFPCHGDDLVEISLGDYMTQMRAAQKLAEKSK